MLKISSDAGGVLLLVAILLPHLSEAIIPKPCVHNATTSHVCCPSSPYEEVHERDHHRRHEPACGGPHRGVCAPLDVYRDMVPPEYRQDDRVHWPLRFFTHMCKCHGNFYGVACTECWFGWEGKNCDRRSKVRVRKNWVKMSPQEKRQFHRVMEASFYTDSDYLILLEQDNWRSDPLNQPIFIHANWHYFFVVLHRYASRTTLFDSEEMCQRYGILDFNHDGPAFIMWHRMFMMLWERALQKLAWENFGDDTFALPYWDWTDETECGVCTNDMAGAEGPVDRFGQRLSPRSVFYNWTEYCSEPTDEAVCYGCHYSGTFGKLTRRWNNKRMPTIDDVEFALTFKNFFDHTEKSGESCKSFHTAVEGFCGKPGVNDSRLYLHNFVHNSLDGSMCCSASATGDVLFIVHHTEVDRMVEAWTRLYGHEHTEYDFPNSGVRPGHCRQCFLTGILPPVRHGDLFLHTSIDLGYTYDNLAFGKTGRTFGPGHPPPGAKLRRNPPHNRHPGQTPRHNPFEKFAHQFRNAFVNDFEEEDDKKK